MNKRILLIAALPLAAACSGPSEMEMLEGSVRQYSAEILGGDTNKAFNMMTARCQERMGRAPIQEAWMEIRKQFKGSKEPRSFAASIYEGDGATRATVEYTFEDPTWNQTAEAWKKENGTWRNDEC